MTKRGESGAPALGVSAEQASGRGSAARTSRSIRLFVSSTFRDMQGERDELVKRVYPQLRKRCENRGVGWSQIDLRWGITDE